MVAERDEARAAARQMKVRAEKAEAELEAALQNIVDNSDGSHWWAWNIARRALDGDKSEE